MELSHAPYLVSSWFVISTVLRTIRFTWFPIARHWRTLGRNVRVLAVFAVFVTSWLMNNWKVSIFKIHLLRIPIMTRTTPAHVFAEHFNSLLNLRTRLLLLSFAYREILAYDILLLAPVTFCHNRLDEHDNRVISNMISKSRSICKTISRILNSWWVNRTHTTCWAYVTPWPTLKYSKPRWTQHSLVLNLRVGHHIVM